MSGQILSYFLCILFWLGCVYELMLVVIRAVRGSIAETPVVGSLLNQSLFADRLAPYAILIIFGWIQIELLLHFIRVIQEWFAVQSFRAAAGGSGNLNNVPGDSRAGRRARLFTEPSQPNSLHETVPGAAAIDASALDNAYALIRVYVWILPVIGFIGTALGMSHAIAGFGESLKGNLDVSSMTARLSQLVIPGLANAFSTTILALVAAIIGHFCSSCLQTAEHSVLNDLDQACVRLLAKVPMTDESTDLTALADAVHQAVQRIAQFDLGPAAGELSKAAGAMQTAANELQKAATAPYQVTIKRGDH